MRYILVWLSLTIIITMGLSVLLWIVSLLTEFITISYLELLIIGSLISLIITVVDVDRLK
jgi:lipid-A-disaccharide synthase-like uncharacterized protein